MVDGMDLKGCVVYIFANSIVHCFVPENIKGNTLNNILYLNIHCIKFKFFMLNRLIYMKNFAVHSINYIHTFMIIFR